MKELAVLSVKIYNYLTDDNTEDKKGKGTKKCVIKTKLNFQDYENFSKETKFENKIKHLEKNRVNAVSLGENHKKFIKNNKFIYKHSKTERHNVFTGETNKIFSTSFDDKKYNSLI